MFAAAQTAKGLADLHSVDGEDHPTIAHTDLNVDQFVNIGNVIHLNDFNRARFLTYDDQGKKCPFFVPGNPGAARSPEEYNHEAETEMVSCSIVYGMRVKLQSLTSHRGWFPT